MVDPTEGPAAVTTSPAPSPSVGQSPPVASPLPAPSSDGPVLAGSTRQLSTVVAVQPAALPLASTPSFFGPQWMGPGRHAPTVVLAAASVTGLVGAASLPWDRPGIGWLITALAAAVAIIPVARLRAETGSDRLIAAMWALAALALIGITAVRAAEWLTVLCLVAGGVASCLAVAGGRLVRGMVLGVLVAPIAVLRALPWVARGTATSRGRAGSALRTAAAVAVGVALLALFGSLFAAADAAFAAVFDDIMPTVDAGVVFRWIFTFVLVALGVLGACFLVLAPPAFDGEMTGTTAHATSRRSLRLIEWALPIGGLVGLFGVFVAIQATVLFGGGDYVMRTAGLTYAEYARSGFWQLLAISVLTLLVIGIAARVAPRSGSADRAWLRALLGALALLSLVVVFSAMSRMWAYEQAYGFTRLRLLVSVCEIWLGSIFVFVIVAGIRLHRRATWLPRLVVAAAVVALLGIAGMNPDRFIAERNVARFEAIQMIDLEYLSSLSGDAVPALSRLPEPWRSCALDDIDRRLDEMEAAEEWRHWNLAREQARRILATYSSPDSAQLSTCRSLSR